VGAGNVGLGPEGGVGGGVDWAVVGGVGGGVEVQLTNVNPKNSVA